MQVRHVGQESRKAAFCVSEVAVVSLPLFSAFCRVHSH
jgi:hypothetical protein